MVCSLMELCRGEPGGWMLEDAPDSPTHKATPGAASDLKNWVLLKLTGHNTLEVHTIDEAYNFRPTVRHPVYTLEEAEMLMSAKRKPKLTATLKAQIEASERKAKLTDSVETSSMTMGQLSTQDASLSEESDREMHTKKKKKKTTVVLNESDQRPPRGPQDVMATDDLIDEIRPADVEDWEFSADEADDDLFMGADFEDEEKDDMEAAYKQCLGSDSSDDEEGSKLDEKGKELKRLIKNGAPEFVPTAMSPDVKRRKVTNEVAPKDEKATKKGHSTEQPATKIKLTVPQREVKGELSESSPAGLTEAEVCRYLRSKGPIDLKQTIGAFKKFFDSEEEKQEFIDILKKLARCDKQNGSKFVTLKQQYL